MFRTDPNNSRAGTIALGIAYFIAGLVFISDRGNDRIFVKSRAQAEAAVTPGLAYLSMPLRAAENVFANFTDRSRALAENKALKEELYRLREEKERSEIVAMKLSRFEQILGANPGLDIPKQKIAARLVSDVEGPFFHSGLINIGLRNGVKKGHPVMTVDGLYGHVLRAGTNSSRVLKLNDLNSRIAVMSTRSGATAILTGNNDDFPILAFVSDTADWQVDDKVITSGDGGVLPRGLAVGTVRRVANGRHVVDLNINNKSLDWVWVYPFRPIQTPEADISETLDIEIKGTP